MAEDNQAEPPAPKKGGRRPGSKNRKGYRPRRKITPTRCERCDCTEFHKAWSLGHQIGLGTTADGLPFDRMDRWMALCKNCGTEHDFQTWRYQGKHVAGCEMDPPEDLLQV